MEVRTGELRRMPEAAERGRAVHLRHAALRVDRILAHLGRVMQPAGVDVGEDVAQVTARAPGWPVEYRSAALRRVCVEGPLDRVRLLEAELIRPQRVELGRDEIG